MAKTVLIMDDNAFVRHALCELFKREPDFEVCGEAENGKEAIEKACRVLARSPDSLLKYTEYIDDCGTALFQRTCELDLEGIVAKQKFGRYVTEREQSTWFKILNREYSQKDGREELFERERHNEPVAGWHVCDLACAGVEGN